MKLFSIELTDDVNPFMVTSFSLARSLLFVRYDFQWAFNMLHFPLNFCWYLRHPTSVKTNVINQSALNRKTYQCFARAHLLLQSICYLERIQSLLFLVQ